MISDIELTELSKVFDSVVGEQGFGDYMSRTYRKTRTPSHYKCLVIALNVAIKRESERNGKRRKVTQQKIARTNDRAIFWDLL